MKFTTSTIENSKSNAVILFLFEDKKPQSAAFSYYNELSGDLLKKQLYEYKAFQPQYNSTFKIPISQNLQLILLGLGKKDKLTVQKFSCAVANAVRQIKSSVNTNSIGFELFESSLISKATCAATITTASRIGIYDFTKYLSDKKEKIKTIEIIENNIDSDTKKAIKVAVYTSYAMKFTKDLVNEPAGVATPDDCSGA